MNIIEDFSQGVGGSKTIFSLQASRVKKSRNKSAGRRKFRHITGRKIEILHFAIAEEIYL